MNNSLNMVNIPKAIREQVWIQRFGRVFEHKCYISWCQNKIDVFNYHCGHDIPASKGGAASLENLYPICPNCNLSMSDNYTLKEWDSLNKPIKTSCFSFSRCNFRFN